MSLLNFNSGNKPLKMYTNTLSSISGDHLTIKPYDGQNLLLEVSANNNIFIKKGDVSYNLSNLITGATASDASFSNIDVTINVNPLNNNGGSLGSSNRIWGNAFIRDISVTNISISGNISLSGNIINARQIIPRLTNDISTSLGITSNTWQKAFIRDLSNIVTINGSTWPLRGPTGPRGPTGISGPTGLTGISGSTGAIGTLNTTQRIYQNICGDISWNAVNGYYGIANHAYPSLNPLSSGVKAVQTWTLRTMSGGNNKNWGICWSAELGIFVLTYSPLFAGVPSIMTSSDGINWNTTAFSAADFANYWSCVAWSPDLRIFVVLANGGPIRAMTSIDGRNWSTTTTGVSTTSAWNNIVWCSELGIFVAIAGNGVRVMTSINGINWSSTSTGVPTSAWAGLCWSPRLKIFVAVAWSGTAIMTSPNGINWTGIAGGTGCSAVVWSPEQDIFVAVNWRNTRVMYSKNGSTWSTNTTGTGIGNYSCIIWCRELGLFIANANGGENRVMTSPNGINWTEITTPLESWDKSCWSPELGIIVICGGVNSVMTSSLKGRPPTSYNVFDSSFNRIDENGKWDFSNINVTTLTAGGASVSSDDRLKHNEVIINNGLDIIDKLTPKFYQKTQVLLDASYNGDLSGHAWTYEAGLIAQELLKISDLSYVVSGGDYYEQTYKLITQTNTLSNSYYEPSANNYEPSANNYEPSANNYEPTANNYEVINNLIAQPYNVNYNSVFIYGLAAIKELHQKIKTRETSILNRQKIIDNLTSRIQALEANS